MAHSDRSPPTDTGVPPMTPAEAADYPRALGLTHADELEIGDVVYFVRQHVHAHVHPANEHLTDLPQRGAPRRPDRVDLLWLDGYQPCVRYRNVRLNDLDDLAASGHVRLVEPGVIDPYDRWALAPTPDGDRDYEPVHPAPRVRTGALTFDRCRSRTTTNGFLEHPIVNHKRGGVRFGRARFVARRPDDRLAAVTVLDRPSASERCDGTTIELARYASHPEGRGAGDNPNNTASWMLGRACRWAALEGFETVITYSGVAANDGGIYRAANFERAGPSDAPGDGWTNRAGRSSWTNAGERTTWLRHLHAGEASPGVARRADARVATDSTTTTLGTFTSPAPDTLTVDGMAVTREELTDNHDDTPAEGRRVAERARALFDEHGPIEGASVLDTSSAERARQAPPAVFGADVDGELVVALAVGGDALEAEATATVEGYAARETKWPQQTATWLLAQAREWAALDGYDHLHVPEGVFGPVAPATSSVATAVGGEPVRADGDGEQHGFWMRLTAE